MLVPRLVRAINERDREGLVDLCEPGVTVEIRGASGVRTHSNEHLWRGVSLRGAEALGEYLDAFFRALPSVRAQADDARGLPCWSWLAAELTGVDSAGQPFAAATLIRLRGDGTRLRHVGIEVLDLEVGPDLLSRGDRDPRRYFEAFLDALSEPGAA